MKIKVFRKAADVALGNWFRLVKNPNLVFERLFGDRLRIRGKEFMMVIALSGRLVGELVYIPVDQEVELVEELHNVRDC